ncbi:MAG TPA: hypothetical protein VJ904_08270 [Tichowtungia sp.]|nr:hypothetical protein [Tichowtungia sp.]
MRVKFLSVILLTGLVSFTATAGFEQFNDPIGGMWVEPLNGDPAFGIYPFGLSDLQAVTSDNRTFEFIPNINLYADNPGDSVWRNNSGGGPDGNSDLIASTVYELDAITPDLTSAYFEFNVDAYDLDSRYQMKAYIKVLNEDGESVKVTQSVNITRLGLYQLQLPITGSYTGLILQAGWDLEGLNANPEDDWGSATITAGDLYAVSTDSTAPVPDPMTFAVEPYALSGTNMSMTATAAVDESYGENVEYLFTNLTDKSSSGWQRSRTWVDSGSTLPPSTNVVDRISDPDYLDLDGNWEGFEGGVNQARTPSAFVTASGGVATVTPGSANEYNFYQTFGAGPAGNEALTLGKAYEFSIVSANDTTEGTSSAAAFVKAFDAGWGYIGSEYKSIPLPMDGSAARIRFTPVAGAYYQVGTFTIGTTGGSYEVSNPTLITTNIIEGSSGLTPDTEYAYQVKARDLSPAKNETGWSDPVSAVSTVTDFTGPTPDPMGFAVEPFALSEIAISMTASNAIDDVFGVEYLFTNDVSGTSSGWQNSPSWIEGGIVITNSGFEAGGAGYEFNSGGAAGATTTNISENTSALITSDGGWAVVVKTITNLASTGFSGGDMITVAADVRALAGKNGGGAGVKIESWGGGSLISDSGEISISPTESWDNYSVDYTIASGADEIRIVLLVVGGSDSEYLFDNVAAFSGSSLTPGTEYTYRVKARDTSPNKNETAWSAPLSATTTGSSPQPAFDVSLGGMTAAGGMIFNWQGTAGRIYELQYKTNLVTDVEWMTDPSPGASGILSAGGSISATSTVDSASVFYRIISE